MNREVNDDMSDDFRVPPHNSAAEASVLGALMLDNSTWDRIADTVTAGDFHFRDHRVVFETIARLAEANQPFDVVTLAETLERAGKLEAVGGLPALGNLECTTPSAANIRAYAEIVRDASIRRRLISAAGAISDLAFNPESRSAEDLIAAAEREIMAVGRRRNSRDAIPLRVAMQAFLERVESAYAAGSAITGLPTGFADLDAMTGGFHPGQLIVLAARPKVGKSALALNVSEHVSIKRNLPVLYFSMEMGAADMAGRLLASGADVPFVRLTNGRVRDGEWDSVSRAAATATKAPLLIDDTPGISPSEVRSRARRLHSEHGLAMVVVDHLGLMTVPGIRPDNQYAAVSVVSRSLKQLAMELRTPVLVLAQLNRAAHGVRPGINHLRDSGSIEQDADTVLLLYREEVFDPDTKNKGVAELNVAAQRNGPTGMRPLTWISRTMRFANHMPEQARI